MCCDFYCIIPDGHSLFICFCLADRHKINKFHAAHSTKIIAFDGFRLANTQHLLFQNIRYTLIFEIELKSPGDLSKMLYRRDRETISVNPNAFEKNINFQNDEPVLNR